MPPPTVDSWRRATRTAVTSTATPTAQAIAVCRPHSELASTIAVGGSDDWIRPGQAAGALPEGLPVPVAVARGAHDRSPAAWSRAARLPAARDARARSGSSPKPISSRYVMSSTT